MYQIFVRSWYKKDPVTKKMVPHMGRKTTIDYAKTIEEARKICEEYNNSHNPGPTSRKAEFTSSY